MPGPPTQAPRARSRNEGIRPLSRLLGPVMAVGEQPMLAALASGNTINGASPESCVVSGRVVFADEAHAAGNGDKGGAVTDSDPAGEPAEPALDVHLGYRQAKGDFLVAAALGDQFDDFQVRIEDPHQVRIHVATLPVVEHSGGAGSDARRQLLL